MIFSILSFIILGGLFYIIKGGGLGGPKIPGVLDISGWLKSKGFPAPRSLFIVAFTMILPTTFGLLTLNKSNIGLEFWYLVAQSPITYILAFILGWGAYFDMGTYTRYYVDHRERPIIDWILFKLYGPLWIPGFASTHDPVTYDLIKSPTGDCNPYEWRRKRDFTGLFLRHLNSIVIFGSIAFIKWYFDAVSVDYAMYITLLTIPFALGTALIYAYNVTPKKNLSQSIWRYKLPIGKSEWMTGIWLHSLLAVAYLL